MRRGDRCGRTGIVRTTAGEAQPPIMCELRELGKLRLERVHRGAERALWRELIDRYHYLGYVQAFGAQLRYFVRDANGRVLGCLGFSSAAWRLTGREQWIDWIESQRKRGLNRIVQQSRFLILPWVKVANLASRVLALSMRRLPEDWQRSYAVAPLLVETLVDEKRFAGTCYRAANWVNVGLSASRGRMDREHQRHGAAPKRIFLYPLVADAAERLRAGEVALGRTKRSPARRRMPLMLSERGRRELERRTKASTATQREALSKRSVEKWRARFVRERLAGLKDRPRDGRKLTYETNTRIELIALACEPRAMEGNKPIRPTIEEVRELDIERGIVEHIGWSTVQRILSEADVRPHHVRGCLHSPDPNFRQRKVNE